MTIETAEQYNEALAKSWELMDEENNPLLLELIAAIESYENKYYPMPLTGIEAIEDNDFVDPIGHII